MILQNIHPNQIKPTPNNVFLKVKKEDDELITASGILIVGVEQDYFIGEIVAAGPYAQDEKGTTEMEVASGDKVFFEKNWHHIVLGVKENERLRIDHAVKILADDDYNYYLVYYEDVLVKCSTAVKIYGELFSVLNKQFTRLEL